jgi:hypothetical protein
VVRTIGVQLAAPRAEDSGVTAMIDATKRTLDPLSPAAASTPPGAVPPSATPANTAVSATPLPPIDEPRPCEEPKATRQSI